MNECTNEGIKDLWPAGVIVVVKTPKKQTESLNMVQTSRLMAPHSHHECLKRFIIHIMTFSGQSRAILSSWSKKCLERTGKRDWLGFLCGWGVGLEWRFLWISCWDQRKPYWDLNSLSDVEQKSKSAGWDLKSYQQSKILKTDFDSLLHLLLKWNLKECRKVMCVFWGNSSI